MTQRDRGPRGTALMHQGDVPPVSSQQMPTLRESWPPSVPPQSMQRPTVVGQEHPGLEIVLVREAGNAQWSEDGWCMLSVHTQNRTYQIDAQLRCIGVIDRPSCTKVPSHPLLGAQLVGGKRREGDVVHLSQPFPLPGMVAVFQQPTPTGASISESSEVMRVLLRLRQLSLHEGGAPSSVRR